MLAYVTSHFVNHSLGLVSVRVMDDTLWYIFRFWTYPLASLALYGAFALHYGLALWALWQRRSLRMPPAEAAQLLLGFCIPFLLAEHVISTRVGDTFFEADYGYYSTVLLTLFGSPPRGVLQLTVLIIAWVHAMIGLRFWLRLKPWYPRWQWALFAFALLLPTLAALGYIEGGRQVLALAQDPAWVAQLRHDRPRAAPADLALLDQMVIWARGFFAATLLAVLAARALRWRWQRRRGVVRLAYPSGRVVEILPGLSVLEASRLAGIPHASVCGGRGRCSTCRVRVEGDAASLPAAAAEELRVLERVGAAPDVRLACQLRPRGDIRVTPLLPATAQARDGFARPGYLYGSEREIAILFADLRAFTKLSEGKLPYDLVFLLNRYFAEMGHAVEEAGGHIDKFIGDGIMALFGLDRGVEAGCREALAAARAMSGRLALLNQGARPRPAGAAAHRHRRPYGAGHRRRDGLWPRRVADRGRRCRQYREPRRGAGARLRRRARRLRDGAAARRHRARRHAPPRDRDPRPGRKVGGARLRLGRGFARSGPRYATSVK